MNFSAETKKTYIPEFNKNQDLSPLDQVVVEWDVLSTISTKPIRTQKDVKHLYNSEGVYAGMEVKLVNDDFKLISGFAPRIKNFCYPGSNGKPKNITNAQTLFEAPATVGGPLIKELVKVFKDEIEEYDATRDDEKNSE
jgi:hypothetical protein